MIQITGHCLLLDVDGDVLDAFEEEKSPAGLRSERLEQRGGFPGRVGLRGDVALHRVGPQREPKQ
eukprot:scaffold121032_cov53-Prasinocladus_malaysianus.AAC.1